MTGLAPTVEAFFTQRLAVQRDASPHTVAAYRDTLRLLVALLRSAPARTARRGSTSVTSTPRWLRRSSPIWKLSGTTARFDPQRPAHRHPLALPLRRPAAASRIRPVDPAGAAAFLAQTPPAEPGVLPDRREGSTRCCPRPTTAAGSRRRDHTLLTVAVQTGLRVSELTRLVRHDIHLGTGGIRSVPRQRNARIARPR